MNFEYKESLMGHDVLTIRSRHGVEIEVLFDNGQAAEVYIDDCDYKPTDDTLNGLAIMIGDQWMQISDVIRHAEVAYPGIMRGIKAQARAEEAMAEELSSPYLTGRI